jgi:hypothetical protein
VEFNTGHRGHVDGDQASRFDETRGCSAVSIGVSAKRAIARKSADDRTQTIQRTRRRRSRLAEGQAHHFSLADYVDSARIGWALRIWNDDEIAASTGFPLHPHANMEIITYVREGAAQGQSRQRRPDRSRGRAGDERRRRVSGTPYTTWLTRAVGCVLFSPQAPSPAVTASIRGWSGDGGDLVSQAGDEPNARSQASFDRSEGARWSSQQEPRRSRTGAQSMQMGDRPRA